MEQDELEDEVFTKTIVTHLGIVSKLALGLLDWDCIITKREIFCVLAVFVALLLWLLHSSKNSFGFFWRAVPMAGLSGLAASGSELEEQLDHAAVVALRGRRSTMEDRYVMLKIEPDIGPKSSSTSVVLHAVLDGHGGEFAVNYVQKHLIENLVLKIKLLKMIASMSTSTTARKAEYVKTFERLNNAPMSRGVLDFIGMSMSEYREANPEASTSFNKRQTPPLSEQVEDCRKEEPRPVITSSLVLSSRVKHIEELPTISGEKVDGDSAKKETPPEDESMCNNMLSPYNNVPNGKNSKQQRRNSKSPAANSTSTTSEANKEMMDKDLSEYLSSKGEILYAELIKDEISKVDQQLVKDSKKEGQVGGTCLLMTILDGRTLWVANVGDSRGVLCNSRGDTIPLSYDHKPCQLKEKKRIQEAGGFVAMNGVWRVQGVLATSRALGDYPLKERKVIVCEPDVLSFKLSAEPHLRPEFAVLASDGLWDIFSNEEAVAHLRKNLISFGGSKSELSAARNLAKDAYSKGSTDNVTVMVINLKKIFAKE